MTKSIKIKCLFIINIFSEADKTIDLSEVFYFLMMVKVIVILSPL